MRSVPDPETPPAPGPDAVERTFRESAGRAVATLARVFGDIGLAEDAVQEAFAIAIERWRDGGIPPNPGGWIVTTARNKALDRLRRESTRPGREAEAVALLGEPEPEFTEGPVRDDQLRLIFTCCHPAISRRVSAIRASGASAGWQQAKMTRSWS